MKISIVNTATYLAPSFYGNGPQKTSDSTADSVKTNSSKAVSGGSFLSQMPNVVFKEEEKKPAALDGDLSYYQSYGDGYTDLDFLALQKVVPTKVEKKKRKLASHSSEAIKNGNFPLAIANRIEFSRLCAYQCKDDDKRINDEGIKKLYASTPIEDRPKAKALIEEYNPKMAEALEHDIGDAEPIVDEHIEKTDAQLESIKKAISADTEKTIAEGNYIDGVAGKVTLAKICKKQGKEEEAQKLEEDMRGLYKLITAILEKEDAKGIIATYDRNLSMHIDDDIKSQNGLNRNK